MAPSAWVRSSIVVWLVAACSSVLPSREPLGGAEELDAGATSTDGAAPSAQRHTPAPAPEPPAADDPPPPPSDAPLGSATAAPSGSAPVAAALGSDPRCDRSKGKPGDCMKLEAPAGGECVSLYSHIALCNVGARVLLPGVAQAFVGCLAAASRSQAICELATSGECLTKALATTCEDSAATAVCEGLFARCSPSEELARFFTPITCSQGLASLLPAARRELEECFRTRCDVEACLATLM